MFAVGLFASGGALVFGALGPVRTGCLESRHAAEGQIPFASLLELVRPALVTLEKIPEPQAVALEGLSTPTSGSGAATRPRGSPPGSRPLPRPSGSRGRSPAHCAARSCDVVTGAARALAASTTPKVATGTKVDIQIR